MSRTPDNAKIHIRLITAMVKKLISEGYTVSADHIGYPNGKPELYREHTPDIFAKRGKGKEKIFIEAETCDSLDSVETKIQWVALSSAPDIDFSIIVPKKCVNLAKQLAKKWGVTVKTFWTMNV